MIAGSSHKEHKTNNQLFIRSPRLCETIATIRFPEKLNLNTYTQTKMTMTTKTNMAPTEKLRTQMFPRVR